MDEKGFDRTNEFYAKLQLNEYKFLEDVAKFVEGKMDFYVPILSGYLKSRNKVIVNKPKKEIEAYNDANYSGFVEKGTRKMRAQPFITPSIYNHIGDITRIAKGDLGNGF